MVICCHAVHNPALVQLEAQWAAHHVQKIEIWLLGPICNQRSCPILFPGGHVPEESDHNLWHGPKDGHAHQVFVDSHFWMTYLLKIVVGRFFQDWATNKHGRLPSKLSKFRHLHRRWWISCDLDWRLAHALLLFKKLRCGCINHSDLFARVHTERLLMH